MKKLIILKDGEVIVHEGIFITSSAPEIKEEYSISEVEYEKAKKDKKFKEKLTKDIKDSKIKSNTLVNKNA